MERPTYEVVEEKKDKWLIERIGNLALCYKTFLTKEAGEKDLDICMFNSNGRTRYTIASFDYDEDDYCYCLIVVVIDYIIKILIGKLLEN